MFGSIGFPEIIMIFLVVLLLFGPNKLPDFARMFGRTIKEFRKTINDAKSTLEDEIEKADIGEDLREMDRDIKKIAKFEMDDVYNNDRDKESK